ncbi:MAG: hypothetical protein HYX53_01465 [Chloroflexi bacterium]|nr:hypothetical protein [Chloroflexota bacterium]
MAPTITSHGHVVTVEAPLAVPFAELKDALDALTPAYHTRAVVLVLANAAGGEEIDADGLLWFERFPIPTIAAVEGDVRGAALDLALACDIRVAAEGARLRFRGIGGRRMMTLLGAGGQVALLERGAVFDAASAADAGLVSDIAPMGEARTAAEALAATIASRGPIATRLAKEAVWRGLPQPLEQALRFETDLTLLLQTTKDRAEGVRAFIEKRAPIFQGT